MSFYINITMVAKVDFELKIFLAAIGHSGTAPLH